MPRPPRPVADGLLYHALNRGNNREAVFVSPEDYRQFLGALTQTKERYPFRLFGYCLMTNHFHLLLAPDPGQSISRILQSLTVAHTWHYHKTHHTSGHVWQGRFKSPVVQHDAYALTVLRYIEGNPLRAGMVADLADYPWSSYVHHGLGQPEPLLSVLPGQEEVLANRRWWRKWVHEPLTGPQGNRGVDQIRAGFIQHITIEQFRGRYVQGNPGDPTQLVANLQGSTYLDMAPDEQGGMTYTDGPWYERRSDAKFFDATPGNPVKTIRSTDAPVSGVPVTFEQESGVPIRTALDNGTFNTQFRRLNRIELVWQFTLDVAAATADTANGANDSYWGEARANWTFNGTGNVAAPVAVPDGFAFPWTSAGAGVTQPTSWAILELTPEEVSGSIFNQQLQTVVFIPGN